MHNWLEIRDLSDEGSSRRRRGPGRRAAVLLGLAVLGFASLYREGFEVVLFLQSYRLQLGRQRSCCRGLHRLALVGGRRGGAVHRTRRRLPYKTDVVVTGAMLGGSAVVMVGEQVQEMQHARLDPDDDDRVAFPNWLGTWFATFATVQGLVAQAIAGGVVIGSYLIASEVQVRRPARRGTRPATRLPRAPLTDEEAALRAG